MGERRKSLRTELNSRLIIKRLDSQEHSEVSIDIVDVSKQGIGFTCKETLGIGEMYEAYLTIWTQEVIHAFLRIVRIELGADSYIYGAVFVGMAELDASRIEVYQTVSEHV